MSPRYKRDLWERIPWLGDDEQVLIGVQRLYYFREEARNDLTR